MSQTNRIISVVVIILAVIAITWAITRTNTPNPTPSPSPSTTTTPTPSPTSTTKDSLIKVTSPVINQTVSSPLTIEGTARGTWYFEASFPVKLIDANGNVLTQVPVQALDDWMTENFVPFKLILTFPQPTTKTGTLILEKSNPSGLPQYADELRIPVQFISTATTRSIKLYYYNPEKDEDVNGNVMCTAKGLVEVTRQIPTTPTPLQDSIRLLLKGELTQAERALGLTTEFPLAGLTLQSATINSGVATLAFQDPQYKTSGGSCRIAVLWAQIEATAKQFPSIQDVKFLPDELFQP